MTEAGGITLAAGAGGTSAGVRRFAHEAMDTTFEVVAGERAGGGAEVVRQAAREAFALLDRLEGRLSRFIEGSDVWQINHLRAGQWVRVGLDVLECLGEAALVFEETGGAFDAAIGPLRNAWAAARDQRGRGRQPSKEEIETALTRCGTELLEMSAAEGGVGVKADGVEIDLGGIGKGFAVDRMACLLREWDIGGGLVQGGYSTVYAWGSPGGEGAEKGWPVTLTEPRSGQTIAVVKLRDEALSASGWAARGGHVLDPRTGSACGGVSDRLRSWARAPRASRADALSTAFLVMSAAEIAAFCRRHKETGAMVLWDEATSGGLLRCGTLAERSARSERRGSEGVQ